MNSLVRQAAATLLDLPGIRTLLSRRTRSLGVIFMLHRVATQQTDPDRPTAEDLRALLSFLRDRNISVVSVRELLRRAQFGEGTPESPLVSFTLDDGYLEQATTAAPVFQEFGVPATIFPVIGFLDGTCWMWWDRLSFLLTEASPGTYRLPLPSGVEKQVELKKVDSRSHHERHLAEELKAYSTEAREEALDLWQTELQVEIPDHPPDRFAPMTWDQARACEAAGISIGPHTLTHPILARESAERVRKEMTESWSRLKQELSDPVPIYCYSNGTPRDFGRREMKTAQEMGLEGALSTIPGYVSLSPISDAGSVDPLAPFAIPRFGLYPDLISLRRILAGLSPGLIHRVPETQVASRL